MDFPKVKKIDVLSMQYELMCLMEGRKLLDAQVFNR